VKVKVGEDGRENKQQVEREGNEDEETTSFCCLGSEREREILNIK
jgi:hypothetical protein